MTSPRCPLSRLPRRFLLLLWTGGGSAVLVRNHWPACGGGSGCSCCYSHEGGDGERKREEDRVACVSRRLLSCGVVARPLSLLVSSVASARSPLSS